MSAIGLAPGAVEVPAARATGARRLRNLDVLRAFAALGVLAIHAYAFGGRVAPIRAQHFYDVPLIALASGVWLFFGISAYVIGRPFVDWLLAGDRRPELSAYLLRRAMRIYPLYWIALTVLILIDGTGGATPAQLLAHYALVNNLVPGRQEALFSTAWTLTLEVLFYLLVPLLALAAARIRNLTAERLAVLVVASWIASIGFTVFADTRGLGVTALWMRGSIFSMWQAFCPGLLLAIAPHLQRTGWRRRLVELPDRRAPTAVVIVVTLVAAWLLSALAPLRFGIGWYEFFVDITRVLFAVGFGLVIGVALRAAPWSRPGRPLLELGLASYGIYLLHPVIEEFMLHHGLAPVRHDTLPAYLANFVVLCAVTIPLAMASWRWLEQPLIRFARARGRRAGSGVPAVGGVGRGEEARRFWNERAREDAFYFVDTRQRYGAPDPDRFWESADLVDYVLDGLGVRLTGGETVLEIGCGLGRITRGLAARAREVIALDVSDEMLTRARELNSHLDNVRWVLGDGTSLEVLGDASVDACVSIVVLQHVPDPAITLGYVRETGRVLRPGGWAALQVSNDPAIHRPRDDLRLRILARLGRAPRGQRHPAWLGSHVELADIRTAAIDGGLELRRVWGEGSQYCQLLLVKVQSGENRSEV